MAAGYVEDAKLADERGMTEAFAKEIIGPRSVVKGLQRGSDDWFTPLAADCGDKSGDELLAKVHGAVKEHILPLAPPEKMYFILVPPPKDSEGNPPRKSNKIHGFCSACHGYFYKAPNDHHKSAECYNITHNVLRQALGRLETKDDELWDIAWKAAAEPQSEESEDEDENAGAVVGGERGGETHAAPDAEPPAAAPEGAAAPAPAAAAAAPAPAAARDTEPPSEVREAMETLLRMVAQPKQKRAGSPAAAAPGAKRAAPAAPAAAAAAAQPPPPPAKAPWVPALSCDRLTLTDGGATATKAWEGEPINPAALVAVDRGGGAEGFALAAVVEALPKVWDSLSFGVGRAMPKEGRKFGYYTDGTCGLRQLAFTEPNRFAATTGFGRRADREDDKLGRRIVEGSRLALHLSPCGAEGKRTARFFVDGSEVAVFADIEDDGGDSDWVAGVTLTDGASVRLVPAEGQELLV